MSMRVHAFFLAVAGVFFTALGATYTGRIVDQSVPAVPIANASVWMKVNGGSAFSGATGTFTLTVASSGATEKKQNARQITAFTGSTLQFIVSGRELLTIDLYDINGRKVRTLLNRQFESGAYSLSLPALMGMESRAGIYILKVTKGDERISGRYIVADAKAGFTVSDADRSSPVGIVHGSAATAASIDSLMVYRMGYAPKSLPIDAYATQDMGDIALARDPVEAAVEHKADSVLALMTLQEKAGQMVQAQINSVSDAQIAAGGYGSVFNGGEEPVSPNNPSTWATRLDQIQNTVMTSSRLKIPIIYGIDAVHGNGKVAGCTVFPHNIGLGCTNDSALVADDGRVTAAECVAVGVTLAFGPEVSVVRNERWGRTYEGYGETPEINARMGSAFIRGLQGDGDLSKAGAIAGCVKHFLGDGGTTDGINGGNVTVGDATMRAVHLPPYAAAARGNMASVMPSYSTWTRSGTAWKQSVDTYDMTTILKGELGFDGFCLSDYNAIPQACGSSSTDYNASCVAKSINAGMDMAMIAGDNSLVTSYVNAIVTSVNGNAIPIARVNDAVKRILRIKFRMNLFNRTTSNASLRSQIFSSDHQLVARKCVRESMVLLKNEGAVLPLKKTERIVVVGPFASNMGAQCGGWTIGWQGSTTYTNIAGQTILQGLQSLGSSVTYDAQGSNLTNADKIVVVVGENPYAEGQGDVTVPDLTSCPNSNLIQTCYNSGKPVVLVMLTGRPMLIDTEINWCKAIVAAWLPGSEGIGVADVLFGDYNFTGKLSNTWPASAAQIPINTGTAYSDEQHGTGGTPLFAYGFGLQD